MAYIRLSYPYNTFLTIGKEKPLTTPFKKKNSCKNLVAPLARRRRGQGGSVATPFILDYYVNNV
jgi:hypothetical protein